MAFESEVDMIPNIDALAEAHYADVDPQNAPSDDDLEAQKEREEERILGYVSNRIREIFDDLNEDELKICLDNVDSINEFLFELLEEME